MAELLQIHAVGFMKDSSYVPAIGDVMRMVKILRLRGEHTDVAKSRVSMPNAFLCCHVFAFKLEMTIVLRR